MISGSHTRKEKDKIKLSELEAAIEAILFTMGRGSRVGTYCSSHTAG